MGKFTRKELEGFYRKYNHLRFVHPDPLEFLYKYDDPLDREIVALVASSLAYGRVAQILKSVDLVLAKIEAPSEYVRTTPKAKIRRAFKDFKHRFTTGEELAQLLFCAGRVAEHYGTLGSCFTEGIGEGDMTVEGALGHFARELKAPAKLKYTSLIPSPEKGSACKRMNLFIRWMVRKDDVDPGGWDTVDKSKLIIPLDTHMHRISLEHGLTDRKAADMRTALEITAGFATFSPEDPVKYDFSLTRPGIGGH